LVRHRCAGRNAANDRRCVNRIVDNFVRSERGRKLGDPLGMLMQGGTPEDMAAFINSLD
jgi:hypothetical protein